MKLPSPPPAYDKNDQAENRRIIEQEDARNQKIGIPIVLSASDGSRWKLVVSTTGVLSTVAA